MGNLFSNRKLDRDKEPDRNSRPDEPAQTEKELFEQKAMETLRYQLNNQPEEFVLNQLLASFQFFGNFDREWSVNQSTPQIENGEATLNAKIAAQNKRAILPDRLQEAVLRRVRYRTPPGEDGAEALHPLRTLLVHDDVEVSDFADEESREYVRVPDTPLYRVTPELAEHKGFVKLRKIEVMQKQNPLSPNSVVSFSFDGTLTDNKSSSTSRKRNESETSKLNEKKLVGILKAPSFKITLKKANNASEKEGEYGYSTVKSLTAAKPLAEFMIAGISQMSDNVPKSCITKIDVKILPSNVTALQSDKEEQQLFETREYLDSIVFAEYFAKVFSAYLSSPLGYRNENVDKALTRLEKAAIYCRQTAITHEIMPTVSSKWPQCADEWLNRPRGIAGNVITPTNLIWPTLPMINHVHSLDCQLIPSGFIARRGSNCERHIEWRITFPEAERYLLSTLQHPQVRCYQFMLTLFRKLLEPVFTDMDGIAEHLRAHIFWQCEMESGPWRDDRLGEVLLHILRVYYRRLQKRRLPDYFVRERNLFESIPSDRLNLIAAQLHRAIERPVVHFIAALVHLQYREDDFYPVLNLHRLYRILTEEKVIVLLNPQMATDFRTNRAKLGIDLECMDEVQEVESSISALKGAASQNGNDQSLIWSRQARKLMEIAEARAQKSKELAKGQQNIIDLEFKVPSLDDPIRRRLLLEFFISHFIDIAERSIDFNSLRQAMSYLEQARRLTKLLSEDIYITEDIKLYLERICEQENIVKSTMQAKGGSQLPKRPESSTSSASSRQSKAKRSKQERTTTDKDPLDNKENTCENNNALHIVAEVHKETITEKPKEHGNSLANFAKDMNSFAQSPLYRSVNPNI